MTASSIVRPSIAVADPDSPTHVLKPNADGSINVGGASSGATVVSALPTLTPGDVDPLSQTPSGQLITVPTDVNGTFADFTIPVATYLGYPSGSTVLQASSGNVANAAAVATLSSATGKTAYISGYIVTAGGATAAALVTGTITGLLGGTRSFTFAAPAGVALGATPLTVVFNPPLPASAAATDIVVTLPALGSGNTNATVSAQGYRV